MRRSPWISVASFAPFVAACDAAAAASWAQTCVALFTAWLLWRAHVEGGKAAAARERADAWEALYRASEYINDPGSGTGVSARFDQIARLALHNSAFRAMLLEAFGDALRAAAARAEEGNGPEHAREAYPNLFRLLELEP